MNNIVNNVTIKLNEIAVSMMNISHTQQSCISSVKMICLLDDLLATQFKNSLEMTLNCFKYISLKENKAIDFSKIDIEQILNSEENNFVEKKSDSFRTLAFLIFEIIVFLNYSIENEKITERFFQNLVSVFNKFFIFENIYLQSDISIKTLEKIMIN